jgi:hypothetical protein
MMPHYDPGYFAYRDATRLAVAEKRTLEHRLIAWELGPEYYDGERSVGYGGYTYQRERWHKIVCNVFEYFDLAKSSRIMDLGCKKGFFLQAVNEIYPDCNLIGVENHEYPISQASASIRDSLRLGNYYQLDYLADGEIDFLWGFSSIYMQTLGDVVKTIREIQRVSSGNSFITLGAYNNEKEKESFERWTLLGTTILSCEDWRDVFEHCGYTGHWFFTTPEVLGFK